MGDYLPRIHYRDTDPRNALERERGQFLLEKHLSEGTGNYYHLRLRYNDLMDRLHELKCGPLNDPIEHLPQELWVMILKEAVSGYENKIDPVLAMTLVSVKWRNALITTPSLWTEIAIGDSGSTKPGHDTLAKVFMALTLSGELSLRVVFNGPVSHWESVVSIVRPHAYRIISIQATAGLDSRFAQHRTLETVRALGNMPKLKSLAINTRWENFGDILDEAPLLTDIRNSGMEPEVMQQKSLLNLRSCVTTEKLSELILHLQPLSSLEKLSIYGDYRGGHEDESITAIPSLALRIFEYRQSNSRMAIHVVRMSSNLTKLLIDLREEPALLTELVGVTAQVACLIELAIWTTITSSSITYIPSVSVTSVRTLTLAIHGRSFLSSNPFTEVHHSNLRGLFSYLSQSMNRIRELHFSIVNILSMSKLLIQRPMLDFYLSLDGISVSVVKYVNSFPDLGRLYLNYRDPWSRPSPLSINAPLESLYMEIDATVLNDILLGLNCSQITKLECRGLRRFGSEEPTESLPIITMRPATCAKLEYLRWSTLGTIINVGHFLSLRKLVFWRCEWGVTSGFSIQLLLRPYECPLLERIEFHESYPEWDWLVLMLERRNFLHDTATISPIRCLVFDWVISPALSKILIELLRCKFPIRPSNRDLSLEGIADTVFDATMWVNSLRD